MALKTLPTFSVTGLLFGTVVFALSLTPSLVPRIAPLQGALSGISFAFGYGLGVLGVWLWDYLELPRPKKLLEDRLKWTMASICSIFVLYFLWQAKSWQNSIRQLMQLDPVDSAQPIQVAAVAFLIFFLVLLLVRLFNFTLMKISTLTKRIAPRRVANVVGFFAAAFIAASLVDGLVFKQALRVADSIYAELDEIREPKFSRPQNPLKTGSSFSLVSWESLGRMGRSFISSGPDARAIQEHFKTPVQNPIRVYVGLRSAETPAERAKLALSELIRVGGFERSILIVATPTGTGWLDPSGVDTIEYLHGGDTAIIGVQYSYLASWLSLLVEPEYGEQSARALFREVFQYWTKLPKHSRPKLYLHGLSLGSLHSEFSMNLPEIVADPYHGALWAGPPFSSKRWRSITNERNPDSRSWLPKYSDGSYVRFTSQKNHLNIPDANWGPVRIVYLQYASDAITFFEPASFYRIPDWMNGERGPDVSPQLRWYPLVSFLQLLVDLMTSTAPPIGYGHTYAPQHYIDAWLEVTEPQNWTNDRINKLKDELSSIR